MRNQLIVGFILAHIADGEPSEPAATLSTLCDLVRSGDLVPHVQCLPLESAAEAHQLLESRDLIGKLVLTIAQPD